LQAVGSGCSAKPASLEQEGPPLQITGTNDDDYLTGKKDNDLLRGKAGDDWLTGKKGNDTLYGGLGSDNFTLALDGSVDRIMDFVPGKDRVILNWQEYDARFTYGTKKTGDVYDDDPTIIYDTAKGKLFWDPNGKPGTGDEVLVAKFKGAPMLEAGDVYI